MSQKLNVLVTGAAGQQGGAVARAILSRGHGVKALTRNAGSPAAERLRAAGAEVVAGDFNDPASLRRAAENVDTLFLMGTPFEAGADTETKQGVEAIDAVRDSGIGHIIYSSVGSADRKTGIPHFDSKFAVERHLAASGVPYTVSAPVYFMENLLSPWLAGPLAEGQLAMALPPARPLQQVALADIGAFVASLVERRDSVFGRRIDIAGDDPSGMAVAQAVSDAAGRPIVYSEVPLDAVKQQSPELALMFEWFDEVGYRADIPALRSEFDDVTWHSCSNWAAEQDWSHLSDRPAKTA